MSKYFQHPNIEMRDSKLHGRGIFANAFIKSDTLIEECHYSLVEKKDNTAAIKRFMFRHYSDNPDIGYALVLGYGMAYNHSVNNNVNYSVDYNRKVYVYITTRDIHPDEELCIYYGDGYKFK